jgi:hypothetical protein
VKLHTSFTAGHLKPREGPWGHKNDKVTAPYSCILLLFVQSTSDCRKCM